MIEPLAMTATKARERYERDLHFRRTTQSIVAYVLQAHGPADPRYADDYAHDIATDVAATIIERMYSEDQELAAQRALAEHYKKVAEDALALMPLRPMVLTKRPA